MDMSGFDSCAQASMDTFKSSADDGGLVPSFAHGLATTSYVQGQIFDVVTNFVNSDNKDPVRATDQLAAAIQAAL
jgi:glucose/mannose transport system substrate-binding protein